MKGFELNMDWSYKNKTDVDDWGSAFLWDGDSGAEYNYCINGGINSSAIYRMHCDPNGDMKLDHDDYMHYEIDWKPGWEFRLLEAIFNFLRTEKKSKFEIYKDGVKYDEFELSDKSVEILYGFLDNLIGEDND